MASFGDAQALEVLDGEIEHPPTSAPAALVEVGPKRPPADANLYTVTQLIADRAARASTRKQYTTIFHRFADALRDELGRPPTVGDVTADTIAAYGRMLEREGGRGGRPAAPATRRVHMTMLRALAAQLGLGDVAGEVRLPTHRVGPPETITEVEYGNLVRAPDRRTRAGKRDVAILRVLGDCGPRNAELRALAGRSVRRPRGNSRHHNLFIVGKGDIERETPIPGLTQDALDSWLAVHPLARGGKLRDGDPLFVRLGRYGDAAPGPLSNQSLNKLLSRYAKVAGIPDRLAHPHALRAYFATTLADEGVPIHTISARLGHADIQTTSRYLAELTDDRHNVGDVLDRRHEQQRRKAY